MNIKNLQNFDHHHKIAAPMIIHTGKISKKVIMFEAFKVMVTPNKKIIVRPVPRIAVILLIITIPFYFIN